MICEEFKRGKLKEQEFASLFELSTIVFSTKEQDVAEHWDVSIDGLKYDVKSLRKENRWDSDYNENLHWVELKNVRGEIGSLFSPYVNYFAFETFDYWIIVDQQRLKNFIREKCFDKVVGTSKDYYELYSRPNRQDIITKVKTLDLAYLATQIIKKQ